MKNLVDIGKTFLIYMAGLLVLGVAAALFSLVLPGTVADRLLGKPAQTPVVATIDAPSFLAELDALGDKYLEHPIIADFNSRTAGIGKYSINAAIQYKDMVFVEIAFPNLCYEVYAYQYTTAGWTFVGKEQEYCSSTP